MNLSEAEGMSHQAAMTHEAVLEYNATQWLHVQPDVECVIHPDGTGLVSDALVLALQVGIDL